MYVHVHEPDQDIMQIGNVYIIVLLYAGVYLSLRGSIYTNGSIIFVNDIGETNSSPMAPPESQNGLQCVTDRMPCCSSPHMLGDWFFPNGTVVPEETLSHGTFYSSRGLGNDGTLNLNKVGTDLTTVTGEFCCVLPDINDVNQTLCAVIDVGEFIDLYTSIMPMHGNVLILPFLICQYTSES